MTEPAQPDLQIFVRQKKTQLTFEVTSPGVHSKDLGTIDLETDPAEYARSWASEAAKVFVKSPEERAAAQHRMAGRGDTLFQLLPEKLRERLWSLSRRKAGETIPTIQILSDEPFIPWELMKLSGREDGRLIEGPFLCEAFAVTRWLRGIEEVLQLPVRELAVVVPNNSQLPHANAEKAAVLSLAGPQRHVTAIEARFQSVIDAFASGIYDAWHFSGHGTAEGTDPNLSEIYFDDMSTLQPGDLNPSVAALGATKPLVFFNACDTGHSGLSLKGLAGWPKQFLDLGAGGFIGTYWKIKDRKAQEFAEKLYELFLGGTPIGEAVRQARLAIHGRYPGDPTWLAYTVFAHPLATCSGSAVQTDTAPLVIPRKEWKPRLSPPGALLQAEYGIVPFHGRDQEMDDLRAWCRDEWPVRVRLYTGAGGMGKTRLALQAAHEVRDDNWRAGFLRPEAFASPDDAWKAVARPGGKVLIVVDYAETRRDLLIPLLRGMEESEDGPYRLILLARAALDWWEQLKADRDVGNLLSGPATSRHSLAPLAFDVPQREHSYDLATTAFAERLDRSRPDDRPDDLDAEYFERALLLHMRALIAVEGKEKAKGEDGVLDRILARERRFWTERADAVKLSPTLVDGMGRAMAAITLGGGVEKEDEAVEVLRGLSFFEGQTRDVLTRTAHLLHECYPGNRWIEPILPDLLGEHLVQREMEKGADELLDLVLGPGQ